MCSFWHFCIFQGIFAFFTLPSTMATAAVALQLIENSKITTPETVRGLNASSFDVVQLLSNCMASKYLQNHNRNLSSSSIASLSLHAGVINGAFVNEKKSNGSNGQVMLQLNMTFPIESEDTLGILPSQLDSALHTMQLKAFAVNNFTEDYCRIPKCPIDKMCVNKMTLSDVETNIKRWNDRLVRAIWAPGLPCQVNSVYIHEGTGYINILNAHFNENKLMLTTAILLENWSTDLPHQFFKGFSNTNVTLVGISVLMTYEKGKMEGKKDWFETTEGLVNLTLMGILGFNLLVILFALSFWACNRSKRAFERDIWDYALSRKKVDDSDPW
ncbi:uncharacterized protein LOC135695228 [Rhopilema esculentum]|uniref:uncharacterized protein LOC135695228 n=1 Tax=Rhopilema esculentum TaxID=499914 RepID=UPI0031DF4C1A